MKFSEKEAICKDWKQNTIEDMYRKGCNLVLVIESKGRLYYSTNNDPVDDIKFELDQEGICVDMQRQPKDIIIGITGYNNLEFCTMVQDKVAKTAQDLLKNEGFKVVPHINPKHTVRIVK